MQRERGREREREAEKHRKDGMLLQGMYVCVRVCSFLLFVFFISSPLRTRVYPPLGSCCPLFLFICVQNR